MNAVNQVALNVAALHAAVRANQTPGGASGSPAMSQSGVLDPRKAVQQAAGAIGGQDADKVGLPRATQGLRPRAPHGVHPPPIQLLEHWISWECDFIGAAGCTAYLCSWSNGLAQANLNLRRSHLLPPARS